MKRVIYKSFGVYCVTTEENYNAPIQDANKICRMENFSNPEEIINYYCTYCGSKQEDFIIADESQEEKIMNRERVTDAEKEYLLKSKKKLYNEYDYTYNDYAIKDTLDVWAIQKAPLIQRFKKHPNYVEGQFMIVFSKDYEREINYEEIQDFFSWVNNEYLYKDQPFQVKYTRDEMPSSMYEFLNSYHMSRRFKTRTISEEIAAKTTEIFPDIHVHSGEKTSRVVNKICKYMGYDKHPDYNRRYARFADALSPMKIKRHTVLSINPLDYLTMSFGNSWASCHTIDKQNKRCMPNSYEGQYSSGTMSYMLDQVSMVLYTVDASYEGNEYWSQPKICRQMFHYGEDKLIQARLYPQGNDGDDEAYKPYRELVQEIISTIFEFPNLWTTTKGSGAISRYVYTEGTHYPDYHNFETCRICRVKDRENENCITIGASPICIECGERHDCESNINHCTGQGYRCECCGEWINEDETYWINGEPYCNDCVSYCDICDEYHRGESIYIPSEDRSVCEYCLEYYYTYCEDCDEYVHSDNATYVESVDRWVCNDCLEENYVRCDICGTYHEENKITCDGHDERICDDCLEERYTQCDDCGSWYPNEEIEDGLCEHCKEAKEQEENEEVC